MDMLWMRLVITTLMRDTTVCLGRYGGIRSSKREHSKVMSHLSYELKPLGEGFDL